MITNTELTTFRQNHTPMFTMKPALVARFAISKGNAEKWANEVLEKEVIPCQSHSSLAEMSGFLLGLKLMVTDHLDRVVNNLSITHR